MFDEDDLLPLSGIEHVLYCERQAALIHIEGQWSDNRSTALGHDKHARVHEPSVEVRGNTRIVRGLRLRSLELGLVGMADVTEFHLLTGHPDNFDLGGYASLPGVSGLWRPFPVEYKKGATREEAGYEVQLCAQAICLEEMLDAEVPEGAIYFGESGHRWQVLLDYSLRSRTREAALRFHDLMSAGATPAAVYDKKCPNCSLLDLCLPKTGHKKAVSSYLTAALKDVDNEKAP